MTFVEAVVNHAHQRETAFERVTREGGRTCHPALYRANQHRTTRVWYYWGPKHPSQTDHPDGQHHGELLRGALVA